MKVVSIKKFGGPEVLEVENIEIGKPGSKEVLVKNLSIGLNFIDTYHRSGLGLSKVISLTSKTSGPPVLLISTAFIIYFTNVSL